MGASFRCIAAVVAVASLVPASAAAQGRVTATAALEPAGSGAVVTVTVRSTTRFTARTRPTGGVLHLGTRRHALARAGRPGARQVLLRSKRIVPAPRAGTRVRLTVRRPGARPLALRAVLRRAAPPPVIADPVRPVEVAPAPVTATPVPAPVPAPEPAPPLALVLSATSLATTEAETGDGLPTVTARLNRAPDAPVTVTVASSDTEAVTVAPETLTFTAENATTPQVVTIRGVDDHDMVDGAADVTFTAPGLAPATVAVTVDDPDVQEILSQQPDPLVEGGHQERDVRLAWRPAQDVVVTVTSSDPGAVAAAPATLTFTPANYAVPQTVLVEALEDDDLADEQATVTLATPGVAPRVLEVTVDDTDVQAILAPSQLAVGEGGTTSAGVRLAFRPAATTTVTVASADTSVVTTSPATLTFTTETWSTPQNVTLTGVEDLDVAPESTSVTLSAPGITSRIVTANVADNDTLTIETNAVSPVTVTESSSTSVGVRLSHQPPGTVTVTATSSDPSAVTFPQASVVFTPANWATFQPLQIHAPQDADTVDELVTVNLTSPGLAPRQFSVQVNDVFP